MNIIIFGCAGSGKGTQAAKLMEKYLLLHLSTGEIFRDHIASKTELGLLADSYISVGKLVPDDVTIKLLKATLDTLYQWKGAEFNGVILDGFPRNVYQAQVLDEYFLTNNLAVDMVIALDVNEDELKKRLLERGKASGRPEDQTPEVIQKRIDIYNNETALLKGYYVEKGIYRSVNGVGEIDSIHELICQEVDRIKDEK